jgi:NADH-quinone oxidoreductase subunit J
MNVFAVIFYILAVTILTATFMAITRRNAVHAVVYLILSFIAIGMIFYLLGAPFLALMEIIIYAGAILVLFLFIIMMIRLKPVDRGWKSALIQWFPAIVLGAITFILATVMVALDPVAHAPLKGFRVSPADLGRFLFQEYWFLVEIASFLLLIALVGALYLGRLEKGSKKISTPEGP